MAIQIEKITNIEAKEWKALIAMEEAHLAELIRLRNDYLDSKTGPLKNNRVAMQQEEIGRLEAVLASKKAQLSVMRRKARNAPSEIAASHSRMTQLKENLAARNNLERMLEMKNLFKAMQKAGITPPEIGSVVKMSEIRQQVAEIKAETAEVRMEDIVS